MLTFVMALVMLWFATLVVYGILRLGSWLFGKNK